MHACAYAYTITDKHPSIQETGESMLKSWLFRGPFPPLSNPPPRARNSLCSPEVLLKRVCFCRGLRRTLAPGPCSEQTSSLVNGVRRVDQPKLTMGRLKECHLDSWRSRMPFIDAFILFLFLSSHWRCPVRKYGEKMKKHIARSKSFGSLCSCTDSTDCLQPWHDSKLCL